MRYYSVQVTRSETTAIVYECGAWEIPILEVINGAERVSVLGEVPVNRDYPDAATEYSRLEQRYRIDEDTGQTIVSMVYGVGHRGVAELEKAIAKERKAAPYAQGTEHAPKGKKSKDGASDKELEDLRKQLEAARAEAEAAKRETASVKAEFESLLAPAGED